MNLYDNSPIDKKSIRKLNSEFNYVAIEVEYRKWVENNGVNEKEDTLYKHLCLLTDKNGMATTTVRYLIKTTKLAYRYLLGGKWKNNKGSIIQVKGCLGSLQNKGLIKYEKRGTENYLAIQILQVPKWEIAKHRFITVNTVNVETMLSPNDIADKLKLFDDAIKDSKQAPYRQSLETARIEFLKSLPKSKRTS